MSRGMHLGQVQSLDLPSPMKMAYDGKYIWVSCSNSVKIVEWFADNTTDSGTQGNGLNVAYTIDTSTYCTNPTWIMRGNKSMWIAGNGIIFDTIHSIQISNRTYGASYKTPVGSLNAPIKMNSKMALANGKIWMVENYDESAKSGVQKLWLFDSGNFQWRSITLGIKPQKARCYLTSCWDGYIYLSSYNNLAILRIDPVNETVISVTKGNAFPGPIIGTPDHKVAVCSYGGMVSTFDSSDTFTNSLSSDTEAVGIAWQDSATYWTIDGSGDLFRIKTDNSIIGTKYSNQDYGILLTADAPVFDTDVTEYTTGCYDSNWNLLNGYSISGQFDDILCTNEFNYNRWNGSSVVSVNMKPRVCLLNPTSLIVINTDEIKFCFGAPPVQRSSVAIAGKAMISYGPNNYLGEKG